MNSNQERMSPLDTVKPPYNEIRGMNNDFVQFLKQGPAYKKEGPDPNKESNQR